MYLTLVLNYPLGIGLNKYKPDTTEMFEQLSFDKE